MVETTVRHGIDFSGKSLATFCFFFFLRQFIFAFTKKTSFIPSFCPEEELSPIQKRKEPPAVVRSFIFSKFYLCIIPQATFFIVLIT